MKIKTYDYVTYEYNGNIWNRLLQLIRIKPKKEEKHQLTHIGTFVIKLPIESED